jgi:hypothetical protein
MRYHADRTRLARKQREAELLQLRISGIGCLAHDLAAMGDLEGAESMMALQRQRLEEQKQEEEQR